jgi:hypothetical protein
MRGQVRFSGSRNRTPLARRASGPRDLLALLRPAGAFAYPRQVVQDPDLTVNEKRAILASWAADASSKDAAPALRQQPREGLLPVGFDDIMDALRELDDQAAHDNQPRPHYRRVLRRLRPSGRPLG